MNDSRVNEISIQESDNDFEPKFSSNTNVKSNSTMIQKKKPWTDSESMWLVIGTLIHGKGNWTDILTQFENHFNHRSTVQLKDRYRNIIKSSLYKMLEKLALQTIDELKIVKD